MKKPNLRNLAWIIGLSVLIGICQTVRNWADTKLNKMLNPIEGEHVASARIHKGEP